MTGRGGADDARGVRGGDRPRGRRRGSEPAAGGGRGDRGGIVERYVERYDTRARVVEEIGIDV